MGGILILCGFLLCGVVAADALFSNRSPLVRLWLGLCMGLMLMMWLPVPYAYVLKFTLTAQLLALLTAFGLAVGLAVWRGRRRMGRPLLQMAGGGFSGEMPAWLLIALVVPMTILTGYLLFTHTIQAEGGALHVGQSSYGDLCLHLGIATGTRNAAFPPDYTILPGALLGYPFLSDTMVTTMLLGGGGLALSFVITGTLMAMLVYTGFVIFAWELTKRPAAVVLAFVLMFFNGGLGFLYTFDGVWKDSTMLEAVFTGYYQTPTNMPDLNLRWVNVVCDMMVPQRTLLCGWTMLLPGLYMLINAMRERKAGLFVLLGIWAGLMPMVHTHSFFALGLMSGGVMLHRLIATPAGERKHVFGCFMAYAAVAIALAAPQLLTWTFPQTINGSSASGSLSLRFNWVNNQGDGRLIDGYFWFWIKNVGLVYLLMIPAALNAKKGGMVRSLALGALAIYAVAELIQFQPNPYDNNKLFYVAYMLMLPGVGMYLLRLWERLRGVAGRRLFAGLFIAASVLSASLSMAREVISDYQLFSGAEVEAAEYIEDSTPEKALFLTGDQHNNAVAALTGRYIVCGTGSYLYFHGMDYTQQQSDARQMLASPAGSADLFEQYGVNYIYISDHERYNYDPDMEWFDENCYLIFDNGNVMIYARTEADMAAATAQIVAVD